MDKEKLELNQNIHALGISYIYTYLSSKNYIIYEVNTDPDHHFQFLAKIDEELVLIAVRAACHPDMGTIDTATHEQLLKESNRLEAIPYFAGLAVTALNKTNGAKMVGVSGGGEYKIHFDGMSAINNSNRDN